MAVVEVEHRDGCALVRLNRPPANALETGSIVALCETIEQLSEDPGVTSVVLVGQGKIFCAGLDLKEVPRYSKAEQDTLLMALNRLFSTMYRCPRPVVAAINGHAIAGGLILALCADARVVADGDVQLSVTEVRVGIPYPVAAMAVCRAEIPAGLFRRMILRGQAIDPHQAVATGVCDEKVPADQVLQRSIELAREMSALPQKAFITIKQQAIAAQASIMEDVVNQQNDPLLGNWIGEKGSR